MSATFETVTDLRGVAVKLGLATPTSRAFVAGTVAAGVLYAMRVPAGAFREDGSMKPLQTLSPEPDAAPWSQHFVLTPSLVAGAVYLFT